MSITRQNARAKVRVLARDRDPADFLFSSPEIDRRLESCMRVLAGRAMLGQEWSTLSVTSATDTFTLPGTAEYAVLLEVRRQIDGQPVHIVSREIMEEARRGDLGTSRARPELITHWPDPAQAHKVRVHPWPDASYTLDILRSTLPEALATDDTVIPFDAEMVEALCLTVASQLLLSAPAEEAARRLVNAGKLADDYADNVDALISAQRVRHHRLRAVGRVRRSRRA